MSTYVRVLGDRVSIFGYIMEKPLLIFMLEV